MVAAAAQQDSLKGFRNSQQDIRRLPFGASLLSGTNVAVPQSRAATNESSEFRQSRFEVVEQRLDRTQV
jgi:hypothetical protein